MGQPKSALAETDQQYRDVVARIPAGVWTARLNGEILFASEQIEEITGFTPEEFVARGAELWARHVHPADIGGLFDKWNEIYSAGHGSLESEYRFLRRDSRWVWLQQRISLIAGDDRDPYIIGILVDVSGRRKAEEELRNSELRYRTLVEQARDVIFSTDLEGRFHSLNHAFETMTGWPCEQWIGRTLFELLAPPSTALAVDRFRLALSGERTGFAEYQVPTKWGHSLTVEASLELVVVAGQAIGTIGIARDVTRRKEAEAQAAQESRLASVGQLATSVAHEFNNVLMSIMPFAELLRRRYPNEERVMTATRHILEAVRRGRDISQQVLRVARPAKPEFTSIVVAEWLSDFAGRAQAAAGAQYRIQQFPPDDRDLAIHADRALLDQVAMNLLTNAREAMPNGGRIRLSAGRSTQPGMIDIVIEDSGIGMDAATLDHIFEPLFTTKPGGSGLGLTIVYQAMKQQDGTIGAESVAGGGSTFTLSFRESGKAAHATPRFDLKGHKRLLIVEDDDSVAAGLKVVLEDEGFDVRIVERGLEAPQAIKEFAPDLVLLDVNLPDISGLAVYLGIRESWPDLPVILSTGHAGIDAIGQLAQNVPSIRKPYDIHELMMVIAQLATSAG